MEYLERMSADRINPAFWQNRRVFVTGHTGFMGGWLCLWLTRLGARVAGYSLPPFSSPNLFEALGLALPGNAAIPAVDARRYGLAQLAGRRIVAMVREDLCMSQVLTRAAFENAVRANGAIGGRGKSSLRR